MITLELICQSLSEAISKQLNYNEDQKEVIAYGIFGLLHTLWTTILILLAGYLTKLFMPTVILLISSAALRNFSGGAHCTSPNRCAVGGVVIFFLLALLTKLISTFGSAFLYYLYMILCFIFIVAVIIKYCPVDSPNKPIKRIETKKRLKRGAFITIILSLLTICFINFFTIDYLFVDHHLVSIALVTGLAWQCFTLLPIGHRFVNTIDSVLKYIIK